MDALAGPYVAAAALLALGGAPKTWAPATTSKALRQLRLPSSPLLVRALGLAEVLSAVAAVAVPSTVTAALLAGWYLVFAGVIVLALRAKTPLATCGCFGAADTPPTTPHLVLVLAGAATGAAFALRGGSLGADGVGLGTLLVLAAMTALLVWFGYLVMSRLALLRESLLPRTSLRGLPR